MVDDKRFIPLLIDLHEKEVVIFGAGEVGERKAELFCEYATTTIVSRSFSTKFTQLQQEKNITLIKKDIETLLNDDILDLIKYAFLVIPATNSKTINDKIIYLAKSLNILTNQVDAIGEVTIPAVIKRGDLTISISTTGSSPAFSRYVRRKIEKVISPEYEQMIVLQNNIRTYLKKHVQDQRMRKTILWKVLDDTYIWKDLSQSYEKAYKRAYVIVEEQINKKD